MSDAPKIAVSLIARNMAQTLRPCLESLRPHVDWIGVLLAGESTDDTPRIARELADAVGEFAWIDDFAAARNAAWAMIPDWCDWALWVDADDVVEGAEHLRELAQAAGPEMLGYWFPYVYARTAAGNPTTVFDRERLVRLNRGWKWQHRIHEVLTPERPGPWLRDDRVRFIHQGHDSTSSASRNLKLLLKEYEDDPTNLRTVFYLGCQYFALSDWENAAGWWLRYFEHDSRNTHEQWWTYLYLAKALRNCRRLREAIESCMVALDLHPEYAEGYFELADCYLRAGEYAKTLHWVALGRQQTERPPGVVFTNPLEVTLSPLLLEAQALAGMGEYEAARDALRGAMQVEPNADVEDLARQWGKALMLEKQRDGLLAYTRFFDSKRLAEEWERIPDALRAFPEVQQRFGEAVHQLRLAAPGSDRRLVIYCGGALEDWAPPRLETTGIGGSETAVVKIAALARKAGWRVDVYGQPGKWEGEHDGVGYWRAERWRDAPVEAFVSWRGPDAGHLAPSARKRVLWLHDLIYGDHIRPEHAALYERVCGVSQWHADYLGRVYPFLAGKLGVFPNGVDLARFPTEMVSKRVQHRCVYSSSPDRGLETLLVVWPYVRQMVEDAELHIFYGWDNIDKGIRAGNQGLAALKERITSLLGQPGVFWRGRLPQRELAMEMVCSSLFVYPTAFLETYCISAVEACAAGLGIVSSRLGAIPEVVGDAGVLIPGSPMSPKYQEHFVGLTRFLLTEPLERLRLQLDAQARSRQWTWERAWERWAAVLDGAEVTA